MNTGTKWIIYLQDLTELSYFRGEIRRCNYAVSWLDENHKKRTQYMAVRGPVETKINYIQKNGISVDEPNYSLDILMTKTPEALKYFRRYAKFYLKGIEEADQNICYRVEATDTISMPGIMELSAVEYYANETKDDITASLVDGLIAEPIDPNKELGTGNLIQGETFIKPRLEYKYFYRGDKVAQWSVDKKYPVILSAKVTDELDKMKIKLDDRGKQNAEKALRLLNGETSHEIIYEFADVSLLPDDFDKKSPDNMILSVALKYKEENPIMLTSDNGLQLKSKILGISTISLKNFLKR